MFIGARAFPPGVGRLPGPAFFPIAIAAVTAAMALLLLAPGRKAAQGGRAANPRLAWMVTALLTAYLALWGVGGFAARTMILLTVLLCLFGENWKRAVLFAAVLTAGVTAAFQYGLRVALQ